jgi:hypothetical protein
MKAESIASWNLLITEPPLVNHTINTKQQPTQTSGKLRREKPEVINLYQPDPPDENKIRELNALATKYPFCVLYKAKSHDML